MTPPGPSEHLGPREARAAAGSGLVGAPAPRSRSARVAGTPAVRPAGRKAAPPTAPPGPGAEGEAAFRRRKRHPDDPGRFAVALVVIYRTLGQLLPERYDPDRRSLR